VLYELLTGEPPFRGNRPMLMHQVLHDEPTPPRKLNDRIPRDLETISLKATAKEPSRRYATASALATDLRAYLAGQPIWARPVSRPERLWRWCRRNPTLAGLSAAVAASLVAGMAVSFYFAVQARQRALQATNSALASTREAQRADRNVEQAERSLYATRMNLAQAAWEGGNVSRLRAILDLTRQPSSTGADLRGWEWYYLDRVRQVELRQLAGEPAKRSFANPKSTGSFIAFSPDGSRLIAVGTKVREWDVATGLERTEVAREGPTRPKDYYGPTALDAGRSRAAVSSRTPEGQVVTIWDSEHGPGLRIHTGHAPKMHYSGYCLGFSPDGTMLATTGPVTDQQWSAQEAKLWDLHDGRAIRTLQLGNERAGNLAFSPDGKLLAVRTGGGSVPAVRIFETADGRERFKADVDAKDTPGWIVYVPLSNHIVFSPDASSLAASVTYSEEKSGVVVFDTATGAVRRILRFATQSIQSMSFGPDSSRLAVGGIDGAIYVCGVAPGQETRVLRGHNDSSEGLAFSPDGWLLASYSLNGVIRLWDHERREGVCALLDDSIPRLTAFAVSPQRNQLVSARTDVYGSLDRTTGELRSNYVGRISLVDLDSGLRMRELAGAPAYCHHVTISPDGRWLAADGKDQDQQPAVVRVWDLSGGQGARTLAVERDSVVGLAFSADSGSLFIVARDRSGGPSRASPPTSLRVYDAATGREIRSLPLTDVGVVAFSPDGERLACGNGKTIELWDVVQGRVLRTLTGHTGAVSGLSFNRDGSGLASGADDKTIRVWDIVSGRELRLLAGHSAAISSLDFSPDGTRLVATEYGTVNRRTVKVWDPVAGLELLSLPGALGIAFSGDGSRIAAVGVKTTALWDARPLTPDLLASREAHGRVDGLLARPLLPDEAAEALRRDRTITEAVRRVALNLLDQHVQGAIGPEWSSRLNEAAWEIVRRRDEPEERYRRALCLATEANRREPERYAFLNTLGVALYRCGRYPEARDRLTKSAEMNHGSAQDLAFLAMSQHQLGQKAAARATLTRLREGISVSGDPESQGFLREAQELLGAKASPAQK
jgi:WD40 repeat protein